MYTLNKLKTIYYNQTYLARRYNKHNDQNGAKYKIEEIND